MLQHLPIINVSAAFMLKDTATWSKPHCESEHQQSVNNIGCCILYNPRSLLRLIPVFEVVATFIGFTVYVDVASHENERQQTITTASTERHRSFNRASTEHQQSWVFNHVYSKGCAMSFIHNARISSLYSQKKQQHGQSPSLKMSINRASTNFGAASGMIQGVCYRICP